MGCLPAAGEEVFGTSVSGRMHQSVCGGSAVAFRLAVALVGPLACPVVRSVGDYSPSLWCARCRRPLSDWSRRRPLVDGSSLAIRPLFGPGRSWLMKCLWWFGRGLVHHTVVLPAPAPPALFRSAGVSSNLIDPLVGAGAGKTRMWLTGGHDAPTRSSRTTPQGAGGALVIAF